MEQTAELVCSTACELGEGPVWSATGSCLWWVDIRAPALLKLDPATNRVDRFEMPATIGAVALCNTGGLLVCLKGALRFFDPRTAQFAPFADFEPGLPDNRPNEGRCDRQGRLWLASMVDLARHVGGTLYRIATDGTVAPVLADVHVPNSLCWSPDGKTMYFTDTRIGDIWAFDFDPGDGAMSNRRIAVPADAAPGVPDGTAVDTDGCLWNARYGAGCVARFTPQGECDQIVKLPVSQVTACTFGGQQLDTLYITSARQRMTPDALKQQPLAGGLFAVKTGCTGLPEATFAR